jgi:hypothetical protein
MRAQVILGHEVFQRGGLSLKNLEGSHLCQQGETARVK